MKTLISNKTSDIPGVAKRILYSLKVVTIGLFIPFLFVFGITSNTPKKAPVDGINIYHQKRAVNDNVTVNFNIPLSDKNS